MRYCAPARLALALSLVPFVPSALFAQSSFLPSKLFPARTQASKAAKKVPYTGPTAVIELAPLPVLDAEGRQELDGDAKPMFHAAMRQQRDRQGHPLFDEAGKPVMQTAGELGYDENGSRIHAEKEKKVKMTPVAIRRGVLTVDGLTGKAALNYDIADLKYIYVFTPGVGTAVISNAPFPDATEQPHAFDGPVLTVKVDDHLIELVTDQRLLGQRPRPAYVRVDRSFKLQSAFPVMGYGPLQTAPYMWPGAKPNEKLAGLVQPPPLSKGLTPAPLLKPCPTGQMRRAALPGQPQPCTPISNMTTVAFSPGRK